MASMYSGVSHMLPSGADTPSRRLLLLVVVYVVGNLAALVLCWWLIGIDLTFTHLVPILFLVVPVADLFVSIKMRLIERSYRYRGLTVAILAICFLTWAVLVYIYLKNVFPETF